MPLIRQHLIDPEICIRCNTCEEIPEEVIRQTEVASAGAGGREVPPFSAAHPYVNAYTRERAAVATV